MYYTGNNVTALTSQKMIRDALWALMKEKKFTDITVSELCERAQVSRGTFYSLFHSKENVIAYTISTCFPFSEEIHNKGKISLHDLCRYCTAIIWERTDYIGILFDNGLERFMCLRFHSWLQENKDLLMLDCEKDRDCFCSFAAGAITGLAAYFVQDGLPDSPEKMESILYELFRGDYFSPHEITG